MYKRQVCSWFLHYDPVQFDVWVQANGSLPSTILGLLSDADGLEATNSFAIPGLTYDYANSGSTDRLRITGANIEASFAEGPNARDHVRIFTDC